MNSCGTDDILLINPGSRVWWCIPGHVSFYKEKKGEGEGNEEVCVKLNQGITQEEEYQVLKGYLGDQAKIAKLLNPISRFFEREIDVIRAWYAFSQHEGDKGLIVYLDVTDETKADEIIPGVNAYMDEVLDELLAEEECRHIAFIDFKALEIKKYGRVQGVPILEWLEDKAELFYDVSGENVANM